MKKIALLIGFLILAGAGVGYYLWNKPHPDLMRIEPAYRLTAQELFDAFESDENAANATYNGQVVEVQGPVQEVLVEEGAPVKIRLEGGGLLFGVACEMDPKHPADYAALQPGTRVTLRGECAGMLMDVVLTRCVLIAVE